MERIDSSFLFSAFTESEGRRRSTSIVKADCRGKLLPSYIPLFLVRQPAYPPPRGGTAIYGLYRYVPLKRVWFSSSLL